jgi:hypothetical protein
MFVTRTRCRSARFARRSSSSTPRALARVVTDLARRRASRVEMDDVLGVKSGGLPRGSLVLITDEVGASGGWLVAHLLRRALAEAATGAERDASTSADARGGVLRARAVCLVAAEQNVAHYAQALRKLGRNPQADLASGRLVILDALSRPYPPRASHDGDGDAAAVDRRATPRDEHDSPARRLFRDVVRALGDHPDPDPDPEPEPSTSPEPSSSSADARRVVIFDNLAAAADDPDDALLASCVALPDCAVVALAHADAADDRADAPGGWLRAARVRADVVVTVSPLPTGAAEDVHGVVRVTHRTGRLMPPVTTSHDATANRSGRRVAARFALSETGPSARRAEWPTAGGG